MPPKTSNKTLRHVITVSMGFIVVNGRGKRFSQARNVCLTISVALIVALTIVLTVSTTAQVRRAGVQAAQPGLSTQELARATKNHVEHVLKRERAFIDSIAALTTLSVYAAKKDLGPYTDSLVVSAHDSLDAARQDSLRLVMRALQDKWLAVETGSRQPLLASLGGFADALNKGARMFSHSGGTDTDELLADFKEFVDSLTEVFRDSILSMSDDRKDLLEDTYDSIRDSLADTRDSYIDHRLDEIDFQRFNASRLEISSRYGSHSSYRGRDDGIPQQIIAPVVTYHHASGFSISGSTYWLEQTPKFFVNSSITAGYDFRLGPVAEGSLSYSHFWFNDSSKTEQAVFTDEATAGLTLDWPVCSVGTNAILDFGPVNELTFVTTASHSFEIPLTLYNRILIEPSVAWTAGGQNSELAVLLRQRVMKNVVVTATKQSSNSFGSLDYELSVPLTLEVGVFRFSSALTYILPLNVIDASATRGFVDFDLGVTIVVR